MSKIKMIATDIDGTILKHNFEFNQEVKDCIKKLTQDGVKVVLVTGRMHVATLRLAEELELNTPIISYQGGMVRCGNKTLYERFLNPDRAREIINWAKRNHVHLNLYMNDKLHVETDSEIVRRYTDERAAEYVIKSFDELKLEKVNKLLAINFEDENKVTMWKEYLETKYTDVYFVKSMPYFCEVCHPEATKGHAVDFLIKHWGLTKEEVMTIGDQNNDIELLQAGGIKVAMGNATDELKATADFVTDTVNKNGFVRAVEKYVGENVKDQDEARL